MSAPTIRSETVRLIVLGLFVALLGAAVAVVLAPFVVSMLWAGILAFATWPMYVRLLRMAGNRAWLTALGMTLFMSGVVVLRAAQSLPTDSNYLTTGQRNLLSTRSLNATGRVGLVTMWTFEAGAAASQTRYSATAYRGSNADQTSFNAGFRVRPASGLTLGASLRHGKVDYVDVGSEVGRNDLDLLAFVNPGGASSYDARLSLTREAYTYATGLERDRNAWTGSLGWNWRPTGC